MLLNELEKYNPELLDKSRVLAISKSDLIDDEMQELITKEINVPIPFVFISSHSQEGLTELKDLIWTQLTKDVFI